MNKIIIFFFFIMLLPITFGDSNVTQGENIILAEFKCYDSYIVTYTTENKLSPGDVTIENCTETKDNWWECKCNNNTTNLLILSTAYNVEAVLDVAVEYHREPNTDVGLGDASKITNRFPNIHILNKEINIYSPMTTNGTTIAVIILVLVMMVVSGIIIMLYRMIMIPQDNKTEFSRSEQDETTDEDVDEYLKNIYEGDD